MRKFVIYAITAMVILFAVGWSAIGSFSDHLAGNRIAFAETPDCDDAEFCSKLRDLAIFDGHSDTLLHRNPAVDSDKGHVSLGRLVAGGVDFQVFAMPGFIPKLHRTESGVCGDAAKGDRLVPLFVGKEPLHPSLWFSPEKRISRMAERFERIEAEVSSDGARFHTVRSSEDLDHLQGLWSERENAIGALLAVEGIYHASTDRTILMKQLAALQDAGVRMIGLTQRASNLLAGSNEDCHDRGGLTEIGRLVVEEIWRRGMVLDLAHAAPAVISDVAAMADIGPVVVSHTGIQRSCPRDRNLSDEDVRNVARAGGVIGIGYWTWAACWTPDDTPAEVRGKIVAQFVDTFDILSEPAFLTEMGDDFDPITHIGLGSDFDGSTTMPVGTDGIPWLIEGIALAERDMRPIFDERAIRAIAGGNMLGVLRRALGTD